MSLYKSSLYRFFFCLFYLLQRVQLSIRNKITSLRNGKDLREAYSSSATAGEDPLIYTKSLWNAPRSGTVTRGNNKRCPAQNPTVLSYHHRTHWSGNTALETVMNRSPKVYRTAMVVTLLS
jgi:hypothetical protein